MIEKIFFTLIDDSPLITRLKNIFRRYNFIMIGDIVFILDGKPKTLIEFTFLPIFGKGAYQELKDYMKNTLNMEYFIKNDEYWVERVRLLGRFDFSELSVYTFLK